MKARCYNPNYWAYRHYGGRGIAVCERWLGPEGFRNFLTDMGKKPSPKHSLDRIDNDRPYSPENCRWATQKDQVRNSGRVRLVTIGEETQAVAAWAEHYGIKIHTVYNRLKRGWPIEIALSTPSHVPCTQVP